MWLQHCYLLEMTDAVCTNHQKLNKLAKARKTRKSPGTLRLKKVWAGYALGRKILGQLKLCVGKLWVQNICIDFLAELDNLKNFFLTTAPLKKKVWAQNIFIRI